MFEAVTFWALYSVILVCLSIPQICFDVVEISRTLSVFQKGLKLGHSIDDFSENYSFLILLERLRSVGKKYTVICNW